MTVRVTLSRPSEGQIVAGGVVFTDGTAVLPTISANKRRFFEITGASIEDVAVVDDAPRSLGDLKRDELLEFADAQIPPIEVKRSASKGDVLEQIRVELDERALDDQIKATATRNQRILAQAQERLGYGQQGDSTVHLGADDIGNASEERSAATADGAAAAGNTSTTEAGE